MGSMKNAGGRMFRLAVVIIAASTAFCHLGAPASAEPVPVGLSFEEGQPIVGTPWTGEPGITETIEEINARSARWEAQAERFPIRTTKPSVLRGFGPDFSSIWEPARLLTQVPDSGVSRDEGSDLPQTPSTAWNAFRLADLGLIPPDSMGTVGPTQFLVTVNGRIRSYTKAGSVNGVNSTLDSFFSTVTGGASTSDPMARFDRTSNRWYVSAITTTAPNRIVLAVSNGPTLAAAGSFTFYFFQNDLVSPAGDTGALADYASLGVDANALYIGTNTFNPSLVGAAGFVVRKSSVTSGGPIVVTAFRNIWNGASGPYSPRGVDNDDPAATEGYFIGINRPALSQLAVRRVSDPGGTPTISGNIILNVPTTAQPTSVPALGSTTNIDALNDRLYTAMIHKNQITGVRTLWTAHTIRVNSSGTGSGAGDRDGTRWYEIGSMTTSPTLVQSGTLFDSAATNPKYYWVASAAMSGQGHMALGCTYAGAADWAGIAVAGRLRTDALGTTQAPTVAIAGAGPYTVTASDGRNRWGDYSMTSVDPADDMTMWTVQEFANGTNSYAVRVVKLNAPPPATPATCAPASAAQGTANVLVTLTGNSVSGSEFFDPDISYPNHIAASVSGGDVTVNSVTFLDPTHLTLDLSISPTAALGGRTITVTNPDGQVLASAGTIFTVTCSGLGDMNRDGLVDGLDIQPFVDCLLTGSSPTGGVCLCGDFNITGAVDELDIGSFTAAIGVP